MRMTSKGQVTIPIEVRERLGLNAGATVEFEIEGDSARIRKGGGPNERARTLISRMRGSATNRMSTDEIMALTRE
jgi:AbrB family looped-hinge helix DNA binding protein